MNYGWNGTQDSMHAPPQVNSQLLSPFEGQIYGPPSPLWGMNVNEGPNYIFTAWEPGHV
ncbi:hypothetical protein PENSPDRAFT_651309 [Peniophora sp. CONT]|nr:hypothetical protein PENSPDRAFT_651309 [Peniophora sp. CONT]